MLTSNSKPAILNSMRKEKAAITMNSVAIFVAIMLAGYESASARGGGGGGMRGGFEGREDIAPEFRPEMPIERAPDAELNRGTDRDLGEGLEAERAAVDTDRPVVDQGIRAPDAADVDAGAMANRANKALEKNDPSYLGPEGYRAGYIWRNGQYVDAGCRPNEWYVAPFGDYAGWGLITQPEYLEYPVYASYPIETAVEIALQNLGLYNGAIDGAVESAASAIEAYQQQNGLPVTGTITQELLDSLGLGQQ